MSIVVAQRIPGKRGSTISHRRKTLTIEGGPQQSMPPEGNRAIAKEIKFNLISLQRSVVGGGTLALATCDCQGHPTTRRAILRSKDIWGVHRHVVETSWQGTEGCWC